MSANDVISPFGPSSDTRKTLGPGLVFDRYVLWERDWKKKISYYKQVTITEEEYDLIGFLHREAIEEHEGWTPSTHDIVDMMFTTDENTGMEVVDKGMNASLNRKIKELKDQISTLNARERAIKSECINIPGKTASEAERIMEVRLMLEVDLHRDPLKESLNKEMYLRRLVDTRSSGVDIESKGLDFPRAKLYPITELVKFDRSGFAPCVWHSEKTGSMKYYKKDNHVHCFGCGRSGDAVDVAQAVHNFTVHQAVDFLTK